MCITLTVQDLAHKRAETVAALYEACLLARLCSSEGLSVAPKYDDVTNYKPARFLASFSFFGGLSVITSAVPMARGGSSIWNPCVPAVLRERGAAQGHLA